MIYLLCSSLFVIGLLLTILSSIAFNKLTTCDSPKLKLNLNFALCIGSCLMAFAASYALCIIKCGCNTKRESLNIYILPFVFAIGIYTSVLSKSIMDESKRCGVEIGSFPLIILIMSILQTVVVGIYLMYLLYKKFKPKPKDVKKLELTSKPSITKVTSSVDVGDLSTNIENNSSSASSDVSTGVSTDVSTGVDVAGISTDVDVAGVSTDVSTDVSTGVDVAGVSTGVDVAGVSTGVDVAGVSTGVDVAGVSTNIENNSSSASSASSASSDVSTDVSVDTSSDASRENCDKEELSLNNCREKLKETRPVSVKDKFSMFQQNINGLIKKKTETK